MHYSYVLCTVTLSLYVALVSIAVCVLQGYLGFKDFAIAMKLIGQLQKGDTLTTRGNSSGAAIGKGNTVLHSDTTMAVQ